MKPKAFATEADLCAAFLAWVAREHPEIRAYAEWEGWDILLVYPKGWQVGVQAKLRLNADVILQAAPSVWSGGLGPDFRAILVPDTNPLSSLASTLGVVVFRRLGCYPKDRFEPDLGCAHLDQHRHYKGSWVDWNPERRHELPPCATDSIAGSPCPVTLTPWKLGALAVLAELAVKGTVTTKDVKVHVDHRRWTAGGWLEPAGDRGIWKRGAACPNFDEQHPTAYALALEKARSAA